MKGFSSRGAFIAAIAAGMGAAGHALMAVPSQVRSIGRSVAIPGPLRPRAHWDGGFRRKRKTTTAANKRAAKKARGIRSHKQRMRGAR